MSQSKGNAPERLERLLQPHLKNRSGVHYVPAPGGLERRLALLQQIRQRGDTGGMVVNVLGGIGRQNPDMKILEKKGLVRFERFANATGKPYPPPKRFRNFEPMSVFFRTNKTRAFLTEEGEAFLIDHGL